MVQPIPVDSMLCLLATAMAMVVFIEISEPMHTSGSPQPIPKFGFGIYPTKMPTVALIAMTIGRMGSPSDALKTKLNFKGNSLLNIAF